MRREAPTISVLRLVVGTSLSYSKATYGRSHSRDRPKGANAPNIGFLEYETVLNPDAAWSYLERR